MVKAFEYPLWILNKAKRQQNNKYPLEYTNPKKKKKIKKMKERKKNKTKRRQSQLNIFSGTTHEFKNLKKLVYPKISKKGSERWTCHREYV